MKKCALAKLGFFLSLIENCFNRRNGSWCSLLNEALGVCFYQMVYHYQLIKPCNLFISDSKWFSVVRVSKKMSKGCMSCRPPACPDRLITPNCRTNGRILDSNHSVIASNVCNRNMSFRVWWHLNYFHWKFVVQFQESVYTFWVVIRILLIGISSCAPADKVTVSVKKGVNCGFGTDAGRECTFDKKQPYN